MYRIIYTKQAVKDIKNLKACRIGQESQRIDRDYEKKFVSKSTII